MKPRPFTPDETQRILEMHAAGWTVRRIADALGRNVSSVGDKIRRIAAEEYGNEEDDDGVCSFVFDDDAFDREEGLL